MNSFNSNILALLKKNSIVELLAKRGIHPIKEMVSGRYSYYCPFPDHEDSKSPSFVVYTNSEYENFHCFGCDRGYTVVHLLSYLDQISFKDALSKISEGTEISIEENLSYAVEGDQSLLIDLQPNTLDSDITQTLFTLSSYALFYLKGVGFDDGECSIIHKFWSEVDKELLRFDFEAVQETLRNLPPILIERREKFEKMKIDRLRSQYRSINDI